MSEKEYIEREAAKKVLADDYAYNAAKLLDEVPKADVQKVRHGKWIEYDNGVQTCSECGEEHEWQDYRASYCEDCGAKMDLER